MYNGARGARRHARRRRHSLGYFINTGRHGFSPRAISAYFSTVQTSRKSSHDASQTALSSLHCGTSDAASSMRRTAMPHGRAVCYVISHFGVGLLLPPIPEHFLRLRAYRGDVRAMRAIARSAFELLARSPMGAPTSPPATSRAWLQ